MVLGGVLRNLRAQRGWTLRKLSSEAHVALGYLSEVERGVKEPSSDIVRLLAASLGVSLRDLLLLAADESLLY